MKELKTTKIIAVDHGYGNIKKIYSADVHLAAGLPLTWIRRQRDEFRLHIAL